MGNGTRQARIKLVVVNGCSMTYGDELPDRANSVWGALLAKRLGADFVNLGACAGSNHRIVRLTVERLPGLLAERGLAPDEVLFLGMWSRINRFEVYGGEPDLQGGLPADVRDPGWCRIHPAYIPRRDARSIAWYRTLQSDYGDQSEFLLNWTMFDAWLARLGVRYGFLWAFDPDPVIFENLPQYVGRLDLSNTLRSDDFPYGGPSIFALGTRLDDLAPGRHPLERTQRIFVDEYLYDWVSGMLERDQVGTDTGSRQRRIPLGDEARPVLRRHQAGLGAGRSVRMRQEHVALVTGANKGIGKATARALAERGLTVLMGARCAERGAAAAAELAQQGLSVVPVHLDVTSEADVSALAEMIGREYGRLDSLVNNAGVFVGAPVTGTRLADFRILFETNVFGAAIMINTLLPWLAAAAAPCIVNVSSTTASLNLTADGASLPGDASVRAAYTASKAALNMLTIQYDREFRTWPDLAHIKINSVTPGYTATRMNAFRGTRSVEQAAAVVAKLATNPPDESTGRFLGEEGVVPW